MHKNFKSFLYLFLILLSLSSCAGTLIGGVASVGLASVQERSIKDAAIDLKLGIQIQEKLFRTSSGKLFTNVGVTILEQRVLLVGNVESQKLRDLASTISWSISPKIKDVLNELTIGENTSLVSEAKERLQILINTIYYEKN